MPLEAAERATHPVPAWGLLLQLGCKGSPGASGTGTGNFLPCLLAAFEGITRCSWLTWWHSAVLLQVTQRWFSTSLELAHEEIPWQGEQGWHTAAGSGCRGGAGSTAHLCQAPLHGSTDVRAGTGHGGSSQVRPQLRLSLGFNGIILHSSIF